MKFEVWGDTSVVELNVPVGGCAALNRKGEGIGECRLILSKKDLAPTTIIHSHSLIQHHYQLYLDYGTTIPLHSFWRLQSNCYENELAVSISAYIHAKFSTQPDS